MFIVSSVTQDYTINTSSQCLLLAGGMVTSVILKKIILFILSLSLSTGERDSLQYLPHRIAVMQSAYCIVSIQ
jgi:hypothetical protein